MREAKRGAFSLDKREVDSETINDVYLSDGSRCVHSHCSVKLKEAGFPRNNLNLQPLSPNQE
jgi:hypothetical protein